MRGRASLRLEEQGIQFTEDIMKEMMNKVLVKHLKIVNDEKNSNNMRVYAVRSLKKPRKVNLISSNSNNGSECILEDASRKIEDLQNIESQYTRYFEEMKWDLNNLRDEKQGETYNKYVGELGISEHSKNILKLKARTPFRINLRDFENKMKNVQKYYDLIGFSQDSKSMVDQESLTANQANQMDNELDLLHKKRILNKINTRKLKLNHDSSNLNNSLIEENFEESQTRYGVSTGLESYGGAFCQTKTSRSSPFEFNVTSRQKENTKFSNFKEFIQKMKKGRAGTSTNSPDEIYKSPDTDIDNKLGKEFTRTFDYSAKDHSTKLSSLRTHQLSTNRSNDHNKYNQSNHNYRIVDRSPVSHREEPPSINIIDKKMKDLMKMFNKKNPQSPKIKIPNPNFNSSRLKVNMLTPRNIENKMETPRSTNTLDSQGRGALPKSLPEAEKRLLEELKGKLIGKRLHQLYQKDNKLGFANLIQKVFDGPGSVVEEFSTHELSFSSNKKIKIIKKSEKNKNKPKQEKNKEKTKKEEQTRLYANMLHNFMNFGTSNGLSKKDTTTKIKDFLENQPEKITNMNLKKMAANRGFYITTLKDNTSKNSTQQLIN